jgi:hypothetical protein
MKVLWGTKRGNEAWQEDIITTDENRIPAARRWAVLNGFTNLRIVDMGDEPSFPDFAGTINK